MRSCRCRRGAALVSFALLALGATAFAQQGREQSGPPIDTPMTPWVGAAGITETVAEITARELAKPVFDVPPPLYLGHEQHIDRSRATQNPRSPRVSQWPPAQTASPRGGRGGGPYSPQSIGLGFDAVWLSMVNLVPPDSQGAVGPSQVLVMANGWLKVFDRNGVLGPLNVSDSTFFNSVRASQMLSDPQVRYDRLSQRWFILEITVGWPNRVVLAVSDGPTITGTSSFTFFYFQQDVVAPAGNPGQLADYPSLGIDNHALYIGANMFGPSPYYTFYGSSGWVVRKSSVLGSGPIVATAFRSLATASGSGPLSPRGVDNEDPSATQGYFLGVDNLSYGTLVLRRISDPGGTPSISSNVSITVPTTSSPLDPKPLGSNFAIDAVDDRLFAATIHKNGLTGTRTLWTAHNIQVNTSGVASTTGGRTGSRWYELTNLSGTPSLVQSGTWFDSTATNPLSFTIPSVAMSEQGHMAIAGTGTGTTGTTRRADIAAAGRLGTDALGSTQAATFATATTSNYNVQSSTQRWGDYSRVQVDPNDGMTMWTFQEWCNGTNSWAVRAVQLIAPPPASITTLSPNAITQGQTLNITVNGSSSSGSGFFDPDNTYPNHLAAALSGAGLTVNSITFVNPTQFVMSVTAAGNAATGACDLTVTNPDGQQATKTSALQVNSAAVVVNPGSYALNLGLLEAGGLSDLFTSDDSYLRVRSWIVPSTLSPEIQITLYGVSPAASPSQLSFQVESKTSYGYVNQTMELWNWTTNSYESVDVRPIGTSDTTATVAASGNLSRFVQSGTGNLKARVSMKATGPIPATVWRTWYDRTVWIITP